MTATQVTRQAGTVGHVREHAVVVLGEAVTAFRGDEKIASKTVDGLGRFVAQAKDCKIG